MLQETKTPKKFLVFFTKESFSYISGKRNPWKYFSFKKMELSEHKKWKKKKKTLWKCFSCFRKLNFSTPSLKGSYFLGEWLMVFHRYFFRYFHFTIDFYYWFWKFLLLIPFFSLHHCFFRCFYVNTDFTIVFLLFTIIYFGDHFLSGTSFLSCCTGCAMDLREHFFLPSIFTLNSFPTFGTTFFYEGFPMACSSALQVAGPPTDVQITDPVYLSPWNTVFSKTYK